MHEKAPQGAPSMEYIEKGKFTAENVAELLGRHLENADFGPVGRPELGFSNAIFRFSYNNETHFVRLRSSEEVQAQCTLNTLLNEHGVPNPEIVKAGFDNVLDTGFMVQKAVSGEELPFYQNDIPLLKKILGKAGPVLQRIHEIQLPKFGVLTMVHDTPEGRKDNWKEFLEARKPDVDYLLDHELITKEDAVYFREAFNTLLNREVSQGVLLHNDFQPAHIFSDGENITGVIDWDRALVGDPMYDLAVTRIGLNLGMFESLEEGYGNMIDAEAVDYYVLYILLSKLVWRHKNGIAALPLGLKQLEQLRSNDYRS